MLLLAGIAGMVWYFAARPEPEDDPREKPDRDPRLGYRPTPSQRATLKYFFLRATCCCAKTPTSIPSASTA